MIFLGRRARAALRGAAIVSRPVAVVGSPHRFGRVRYGSHSYHPLFSLIGGASSGLGCSIRGPRASAAGVPFGWWLRARLQPRVVFCGWIGDKNDPDGGASVPRSTHELLDWSGSGRLVPWSTRFKFERTRQQGAYWATERVRKIERKYFALFFLWRRKVSPGHCLVF